MVAYMLPQKDPFFRHLPLPSKVRPLMQHILGKRSVISSFNGFTMSPGSENQDLHIDQPASVPGTVLNINAMFCLDDFTIEKARRAWFREAIIAISTARSLPPLLKR
jgi:ectoine hydroxylase-related dioxygenase (phytanoyl-CoA dioxygenase family)